MAGTAASQVAVQLVAGRVAALRAEVGRVVVQDWGLAAEAGRAEGGGAATECEAGEERVSSVLGTRAAVDVAVAAGAEEVAMARTEGTEAETVALALKGLAADHARGHHNQSSRCQGDNYRTRRPLHHRRRLHL